MLMEGDGHKIETWTKVLLKFISIVQKNVTCLITPNFMRGEYLQATRWWTCNGIGMPRLWLVALHYWSTSLNNTKKQGRELNSKQCNLSTKKSFPINTWFQTKGIHPMMTIVWEGKEARVQIVVKDQLRKKHIQCVLLKRELGNVEAHQLEG